MFIHKNKEKKTLEKEKKTNDLAILQAFFGVFDGHGGPSAAEFVAENLDKNITNELETSMDDGQIAEAVKGGYMATDSQFLKKDVRGGACSVTALIMKGNLVVSNAGDCRAVVSRGGAAESLTSDHRPSREDERERIEKLVIRDIVLFHSCSPCCVWQMI